MVSGLHELPYPTRLCKLKLPTLVYRRRRGNAILVNKLINSKAVPGLLPLASQDSCTRKHKSRLSRHFSSKQQCTHFLTTVLPTSGTNYCQIPLLPKPQTALRTILTTNGKKKNGSITGKHSNWNQQHQTTSQVYGSNYVSCVISSGVSTRKNPYIAPS